MQLTRTERWMLANQYRILEALYPNEAKVFAEARTALEDGYELEYKTLVQNIYDGDDTMSEAECNEVLDTLQMYSDLHFSYERLDDKSGIDPEKLAFEGYDGNNETKFMAYARYFTSSGGGRFTELVKGDLNSHGRMRDVYQRQRRVWWQFQGRDEPYLTKENIQEILEARRRG
jgi:uncharacterized protein